MTFAVSSCRSFLIVDLAFGAFVSLKQLLDTWIQSSMNENVPRIGHLMIRRAEDGQWSTVVGAGCLSG